MNTLEQFSKKKYLNLETFRKNGKSVRTTVWFIQEGETIYVNTWSNSGKVKRIRKKRQGQYCTLRDGRHADRNLGPGGCPGRFLMRKYQKW